MDRQELAWAAGFFDGEGSAWAQAQKGRRTRQPYAQINQADSDGVPEVLERFHRAVGCGQIYGPKREAGRIDVYSWVASSRPNVQRTCEAIARWIGPVKGAQFGEALAQRSPSSGWDAATDLERRAWAAGLFDGEGSTCLVEHRSHAGYLVGEMSVTQTSALAVPDVLERYRSVVDRGNITGPVMYHDCAAYKWRTYSLDDIASCFHLLAPQLGGVKRQQALGVIATLGQQSPLARGNPTWGSHKSHCVKGHEYATARIRPFVGRGKNTSRRDSKQCLACLREYARRQRLEGRQK